MSNKETIQSYNKRLNTNNISLDEILESVNKLPEHKEVSLQDKTITIKENGTQNITSDDGYDGLGNVEVTVNVEGSGGGGGLGQPFPLYDITNSINGALGSQTSHSISLYSFAHTEKKGVEPNMALVFWFARSKCSISDNVTQIYESPEFSDGGYTQKLYIGYMEYVKNATITLTQESSQRLGIGYLPLCNCGIPEVVNTEMISNSSPAYYSINTDEYLNVYIVNNIYCFNLTPYTNLPAVGQITSAGGSRIGCVLSNSPIKDAKIHNNDMFYGCIAQVRCPVKGM